MLFSFVFWRFSTFLLARFYAATFLQWKPHWNGKQIHVPRLESVIIICWANIFISIFRVLRKVKDLVDFCWIDTGEWLTDWCGFQHQKILQMIINFKISFCDKHSGLDRNFIFFCIGRLNGKVNRPFLLQIFIWSENTANFNV